MSAGDQDTLADELRAAFDKWDGHGAYHGYSAADDSFWLDGFTFAELADVLLASDWLREQRAEAWDEGAEGLAECQGCIPWPDGVCACPERVNPYRTTEDTDAH